MKERISLFDNIKFLLIFLVVLGHLIEKYTGDFHIYNSVFVFIYTFHMPLFIFISGLFYKKKSAGKNVLTYLVLWFLVYCVNHCVYIFLGQNPRFRPLTGLDGLPWFMFAMAAFWALTYFLDGFGRKKVLLLSLIPPLISGFFPVIHDAFALSRIIVYYPYFLAGSLIRPSGLIELRKNKTFRFTGITILILWFLFCLFAVNYAAALRHLFTGRNPYNPAYFPFGPFLRLFCYALTSAVSAGIISLVPENRIPLISEYGKRTVQVYFWSTAFHKILIIPTHTYVTIAHMRPGIFIIFLIALGETLLLSTKAASFPTSQIMALISDISSGKK